jgi:hypothetical protein
VFSLKAQKLMRDLFLTFLLALPILAQSDETKFAEGRTAFDKYKDCPAALRAFDAISPEGRRDPVWISYMAHTQECLGNLAEAVRYYEQYDLLVPGQVDVISKLGDLRYRLSKQADDAAAAKIRSDIETRAYNDQHRRSIAAERRKEASIRDISRNMERLKVVINNQTLPRQGVTLQGRGGGPGGARDPHLYKAAHIENIEGCHLEVRNGVAHRPNESAWEPDSYFISLGFVDVDETEYIPGNYELDIRAIPDRPDPSFRRQEPGKEKRQSKVESAQILIGPVWSEEVHSLFDDIVTACAARRQQ